MPEDNRERLLDSLQEQLRSDYEEFRGIRANSKGDQYERKLAGLLESYFGGLYDIRTRAAIIDSNRKSFDLFDFSTGEEEIDVVALFKQSRPKVVFETGEEPKLSWVPHEGVAFVCEVKSQLNSQALEDDLGKLEKVHKLNQELDERFGPKVGGEYTVDEPLLCLVYDSASISNSKLEELLQENKDHWDIVLLVEEDLTIINSDLPVAQEANPSSERFGPSELDEAFPDEVLDFMEKNAGIDPDPEIITIDRGLLWFITAIAVSIPDPLSVSTVDSILSLTQGTRFDSGAKTELED